MPKKQQPSIEARTLKGFRDFLPRAALTRQRVIQTIVATYESFGFVPLETPALEYADILAGKYGDEGEKLMYRFRDQGGREVALRYDLTVPLARVVGQQNEQELPRPFRRYQIAPVWRAENTQKGRFREFTQCDADIVGSSSMLADAEIALLIATALKKLSFTDYEIRLNNRKLLNGFLEAVKIPEERWLPTLRILDKWEKIGADAVQSELSAGMSGKQIDALFDLMPTDEEADDSGSWGKRIAKQMKKTSEGAEGLKELQAVRTLIEAVGMDDVFRFDVLLARGLDYYTGTIFEAVLTNKPEFGSVFGGGRYDGLIGLFTGKEIPAVGVSAGIDRIVAAMAELELDEGGASTADVLVTIMEADDVQDMLKLAADLRNEGIKAELFYEPARLEKQLKYADSRGIPLALILGSEEKSRREVAVKILAEKRQIKVRRGEIAKAIREILDEKE